jgi:hypothetical protein
VALVPAQAPFQLAKVEPAPAAAVRVTLVLAAKLAVQVFPQSIPAGKEVTVPFPRPANVMLRGKPG